MGFEHDRNCASVLWDDRECTCGVSEDAAEVLLSSLPGWHRAPEDHRAETPKRMVKALRELTTPEEFNFTTFASKSDEMIVLGPIPFYSLCAHHVLPFFGNAYVAYVPDQLIAGLSKFARAVKETARGFWVQEELTDAVAYFLEGNLDALGIGVIMEAEHLCMAMRGIEAPGVITSTSAMLGVFADHSKTAKAEFIATVERRKK